MTLYERALPPDDELVSACSVYDTEALAPLEASTVAVRVTRPLPSIEEPDDASRLAFPALPSRSMPDPDDEDALIFLAVMHSAFVFEPEDVSMLKLFMVADLIFISLPDEVLALQMSHLRLCYRPMKSSGRCFRSGLIRLIHLYLHPMML